MKLKRIFLGNELKVDWDEPPTPLEIARGSMQTLLIV
jgi:hypothetical protein